MIDAQVAQDDIEIIWTRKKFALEPVPGQRPSEEFGVESERMLLATHRPPLYAESACLITAAVGNESQQQTVRLEETRETIEND